MPCSALGTPPVPTGGSPDALLARTRKFEISCGQTNGDLFLVNNYHPLAMITCPANCSTAGSRGVFGRRVTRGGGGAPRPEFPPPEHVRS